MGRPIITIGTVEIGGLVAILAREFRRLGYKVRTVLMFKNWSLPNETYDAVGSPIIRYDFQYDFEKNNTLRKLAMGGKLGLFGFREFIKSLGKNNWFIFVYGSNFLPFHYSFPFFNYLDYALLKKLGNVIVSIFLGCDIRDKLSFNHYAEKYHIPDVCGFCSQGRLTKCDPARQRRVARGANRYSDVIITVPDLSPLLTKPYYYLWLPIELSHYRFHIPKNIIPRIVHAPNDRGMKGTSLILQSLDRLRQQGQEFELVLLENQPHKTIRKELTASDLLLDQTYSKTTAKLALEGMASGCAVLCGLNREFQGLPEDCPAVEIKPDPDNICRVLKELMDNRDRICDLAKRGRAYVEKYHDSAKVARQIIHWIEDRPKADLIAPLR